MKIRKRVIILCSVIIIFLIFTILSFVMYIKVKSHNDSIYLVKMVNVGSENIACKLDVSFISGKIAERSGISYYLAGDDKNIFIISTDKPLPKELEEIKRYSYSVIDEKPESYQIIGGSYEIEDGLKAIALKAYNELFKDQQIEEEQFEEYFGDYFLNIEEIYDDTENIRLVIVIISTTLTVAIAAISCFIIIKK